MSQDQPVKRSPEVLELEALADNYDQRREAYGKAAILLRQFGEQLGSLELLIEESQKYDVDDLPETLRQKMRSLVDRTIPVGPASGETGGKVKRSKDPKGGPKAANADEASPKAAAAVTPGEYSPQPIARRKLVQIFVDQGAPKESLQSVGTAAANGIRGTIEGLYHYRTGTEYKGKQPSATVANLAAQLGLAKGGGDDQRWGELIRDLLEQGILSIEDSQRLTSQQPAGEVAS